MEHLFEAISIYSSSRYEEDFVDRLNFQTTSLVFFIATSVIFYQSFFGKALLCWTPVQFRGGWDEYADDFCFVENTYFVPVNNRSLPDDNDVRENAKLPYYQWVPFVLALQAMCFCIPHIFWRMVNWLSGVQVRAVVSMAVQASSPVEEVNEAVIKMIANHLSNGLKISREEHRYFGVSSNPIGCLARMVTLKMKCYITFCYFTMKGLFIANLLIQLAVINFFLSIPSGDAFTWGVSLLIRLFQGNDWSSTGIFPRVTMCDFEIRELGNIHRWSVQCVLPLNMFSEKIYILLWFWLHIMFATTLVNTIIWLLQIMRDQSRINFIEDMLTTAKIMDESFFKDTDYEKNVQRLYNDLGWDGILVLRILLSNAGQMPCVAVMKQLYKKYSVDNNGTMPTPQLINAMKQ
uniref:Innexin n=1 Tax=Ascaris suum TaxID=6253 RepID=F1L798_ASCSU